MTFELIVCGIIIISKIEFFNLSSTEMAKLSVNYFYKNCFITDV